MARQRLQIQAIEAYVADLEHIAGVLKDVIKGMREAGLTEIWAHFSMIETTYIPKTSVFAGDCLSAMVDARSAKAGAREPSAVREKLKAKKTTARRQAERNARSQPRAAK